MLPGRKFILDFRHNLNGSSDCSQKIDMPNMALAGLGWFETRIPSMEKKNIIDKMRSNQCVLLRPMLVKKTGLLYVA